MNCATNLIRLSAITGAVLAFSGCGAIAEKVSEEGVERIIEAESGENVELDFDSDDGSFSIETDEGGLSLDDDGNFVVTDQDGSIFTGSASDDGLVVRDDNGDPVLNIEGDADSGEFTVQGEDGESVYRVESDIPAEWPSDIPRPDGLEIENAAFASGAGDTVISVFGSSSGNAADYAKDFGDLVAGAGLAETGRFDSATDDGSTTQRNYENAEWELSISGFADDSSNVVTIILAAKNN